MPLYDIDPTKLNNDKERITTFLKFTFECADMRYYARDNLLVETLTFILLNCKIDIRSKLRLFCYQVNSKYVPWDFSVPKKNSLKNLHYVDFFKSLIQVMLRLDVNRQVLQCYHCKTKCSCEVVATYSDSELDLFTMQDSTPQVIEPEAEIIEPENPITLNNGTFIIDVEYHFDEISSLGKNVMLIDSDQVEVNNEGVATHSICYVDPPLPGYDAWKGHNDDGIPFINFDALCGHKDKDDLGLQQDCRV